MISGKSHSGKGTLSEKLESLLKQTDKNIIRCSLSTYIRDITKNDFYWDGKDTTEARQFMGEVYRLATELIYPYHMARRVWEKDIIPDLKKDNIVIVESLREKNNLDYFNQLKDKGLISQVITVKVIRPGYSDISSIQQKHVSETDLDDYKFDHYIYNDSTIDELYYRAVDLLNIILLKHSRQEPLNLQEPKDISIPCKVKITKILNSEAPDKLNDYIGKEGYIISFPIIKDNIKRYKVYFLDENEEIIDNETFRLGEFEVI
jgi:hypothetical protein